MPQLNTAMFLNQYGNIFFLFFALLFFFLYILLPQVKKNFFFRKKISTKRLFKESLLLKEVVFIWL
uniref:ATP synthase 8 n=1 Tax=Plesiastrea versipora TaxID=187483 RepID=A0A290QVB4_9CNID|nr:ATP synthase F0 subunit 8 [Plesiastrea versipora]WGC75889.1 ATP synthase F0 subunit 8 [Plesiastrea peroni]ATC69348.1 ATP synthase F0 subunit 8 [Plesiastrea versipora]QBX99289.1 ATP synthase 8 [Plesiastrea versipora]WGC76384.1 ATP synthase F0 subunit 8 [Plesiastrea versipora]WGC76397.1 ATP synthase F0 subunit 8 [Plesiastrea versipora]